MLTLLTTSPTLRRPRRTSVAAIVVLAAFAPVSLAQLEPPANAADQPLKSPERKAEEANQPLSAATEARIDALSSSDFATRERATAELMGDDKFTLPVVEKILTTRQLPAETRQRLLQIARRWFLNTDRPAMGVRFNYLLPQRVAVDTAFKPFDAGFKLERGDLITEVDGVPLRGPGAQAAMRMLIISHDPGDVLAIVVRRGKDLVNLNVTLGRFNALPDNQQGFIPEDTLNRAWRLRAARLGASRPEPVAINYPADMKWQSEKSEDRRQLEFINRQSQEQPAQVVGGGVPRQARLFEPEQRMMQQIVMVGNQRRIINVPLQDRFQFGADFSDQMMTPAQELDTLAKVRIDNVRRLRTLPDPANPAFSPREAAAAQAAVAPYLQEIEVIDRQRAAIEAELAAAGTPASPTTTEVSPASN